MGPGDSISVKIATPFVIARFLGAFLLPRRWRFLAAAPVLILCCSVRRFNFLCHADDDSLLQRRCFFVAAFVVEHFQRYADGGSLQQRRFMTGPAFERKLLYR